MSTKREALSRFWPIRTKPSGQGTEMSQGWKDGGDMLLSVYQVVEQCLEYGFIH